ncbi:MAG: hypothetical protein AAFR70_09180 [Pseudomonadota bacterium]
MTSNQTRTRPVLLTMLFASVVAVSLSITSSSANARAWTTPTRGSAERAKIMNAMRPSIAKKLNAPIEFVVKDLRVLKSWAFARVIPQRPGGRKIDITKTPMRSDAEYMDGVRTEVFLRRTSTGWRVVDFVIGSTDAWWVVYCDKAPKQLLTGYCPK